MDQVKRSYEEKIESIERENEERITRVAEELNQTKEFLSTEQEKLNQLNTEHKLALQKCEQQSSKLE